MKSLESAQDGDNYSKYQAPTDAKITTAVMQKKTRQEPEVKISWTNQEVARSRAGRRPAVQLGRVPAGVTSMAQAAKTPLECFELFVPPEFIARIVKLSNDNINRQLDELTEEQLVDQTMRKQTVGQTVTDPITPTELRAFLGLMLFRGLLNQNMNELKRLFEDQIGHPVFSATMSKHRFEFIKKCLKFDDPTTRGERFKTDKFAAFRDIFEAWNELCALAVNPGDFVTIDECLYACRNQIGFKTFNPNKPSKYGINIKCLNEVSFPYTYRSEVFAGKPDNLVGAQYYTPTTQGVTVRLLEKVGWRKLQGSNLTTDNLYTSIPLAQLLLEKGVSLLGTMRSNRKGLTKDITDTKNREENSSVVWHENSKDKIQLISYVVNTKSKGKKNIVVLSTVPNLATLGQTKDDHKEKPAAIKVYDFSKGGTDIMDQRMGSFTTSTKSNRWPLKMLSYLLDVSRVNAQTVSSLNSSQDPRTTDSFRFGWDLAMSLVKPQMIIRKPSVTNKKVLAKINMFLDDDDDTELRKSDGGGASPGVEEGPGTKEGSGAGESAKRKCPALCSLLPRKLQ